MKKYQIILIALVLLLFGITAYFPINNNKLLISAKYTVQISDDYGNIIKQYERQSDSYVLAFADILYSQMASLPQSIPDYANTNRTVDKHANNLMCNNPNTTNTYGIVYGTGTNSVSLTDYGLQTLITSGTGAGQLSYQPMSYVAPQTSSNTRYFTFTRSAKNNTASTITVNECGIQSQGSSTPYYFLIIRDVISGGQAVSASQTITITYTISITV